MSLTDLLRQPDYDQRDEIGGLFEFDPDDPDFQPNSTLTSFATSSNVVSRCAAFNINMSGLRKVQTSPMTLSSLHQITVDHLERSFSNQDKADSMNSLAESESDSTLCAADNMLTIESLRMHLNSCFSCGVSWQDDHVSLDCSECGGYSLTRPCPICEGKCGQQWKRDLATSHSLAKANWNGNCGLTNHQPTSEADILSHRFHTLRTAS